MYLYDAKINDSLPPYKACRTAVTECIFGDKKQLTLTQLEERCDDLHSFFLNCKDKPFPNNPSAFIRALHDGTCLTRELGRNAGLRLLRSMERSGVQALDYGVINICRTYTHCIYLSRALEDPWLSSMEGEVFIHWQTEMREHLFSKFFSAHVRDVLERLRLCRKALSEASKDRPSVSARYARIVGDWLFSSEPRFPYEPELARTISTPPAVNAVRFALIAKYSLLGRNALCNAFRESAYMLCKAPPVLFGPVDELQSQQEIMDDLRLLYMKRCNPALSLLLTPPAMADAYKELRLFLENKGERKGPLPPDLSHKECPYIAAIIMQHAGSWLCGRPCCWEDLWDVAIAMKTDIMDSGDVSVANEL